MKLAFAAQVMLVASVNCRAESHGQEKEPAGDLGLSANLPNDVLGIFSPSLKSALYFFDKDRPQDLAEQGRALQEGHMPHLKYPRMAYPLKWQDEMANAKVTVRPAGVEGTKHDVVIMPCKVNNFTIEPLEGGTIKLGLRVQYKQDEKQAGKLAMLVQQEVEVTLEEATTQTEIQEGAATAEA